MLVQNDSVQFHAGNRGLEAFVLLTVPKAFGGTVCNGNATEAADIFGEF